MVWSDGTVVDFEDWYPGQPDCATINAGCSKNHKEMCTHVFQGDVGTASVMSGWMQEEGVAWNDAPCCGKLRSICKLNL